jgi:hypothetical protein
VRLAAPHELRRPFDPTYGGSLTLSHPIVIGFRFGFLGDLSEKRMLKNKKAKGMVTLDATEANIFDNKAPYPGRIQQ